MKDFLGIIVNTILWVLVVILGFFVANGLYQRVVKENAYSGFFGISYSVVVSGSMEPNLHVNDMIIYQEKDVSEYEVGDIIVYKHLDGENVILVTHRIVAIDDGVFTTKGDNNDEADRWIITENNLVGRVVWRIPYVGIAVNYIKTPIGLIIIGIIMLGCIFLNIMISKGRKKKRAIDTVMGSQYIEY